MTVAFDKVGRAVQRRAPAPANAGYRDMPMLEDLARLAIRSLARALAGGVLSDDRGRLDRQTRARRGRGAH